MSLCCVHFSVSVAFVCVYFVIYVLFIPISLCFCLWVLVCPFLFFIPLFLSDGRSSSQTLKEEKEAPPLNPPHSRKGRFQVGVMLLILSLPLISPSLQSGQIAKCLPRPLPSGDSSAPVLSTKGGAIRSQ